MKYLIFLLLFSCSTTPKKEYPNVDSALVSYIKEFNQYHLRYKHKSIPKDIKVLYKDISDHPNAGGMHDRISKVTTINKSIFQNNTKLKKESVVFHELGHHILHLTHDWSSDNMLSKTCPRSIMYFKGVPDKCYKRLKWYYIREMFNREPAHWWR